MPNKNTFSIKPIENLIKKYNNVELSIDPFANNSKLAKITNDLDEKFNTNYHLDAIEFLNLFENDSIDLILNDPPYNESQLKFLYNIKEKSQHLSNNNEYWLKLYELYYRKLKVGGYILTFGWNSDGTSLRNLFEIEEILLVAHGGIHYDTICVVEKKI